tara:strand:+ start:1488 stop:2891 length:1404 start_codon:yes stop_codon:yes gene_type:complete
MNLKSLMFFLIGTFVPASAFAHVSERALILLLPTEFYIPAGIAVLILTILIAYLTPVSFITSLFLSYKFKVNIHNYISVKAIEDLKILISCISLIFLITLIIFGYIGSRDPLANPLSLFIWSVWFMVMPVIQIIFGNVWAFLNPWYGFGRLFFKNKILFKLDQNYSLVFSSVGFLLFSLFMLVDIAPDDPDRLANIVTIYLLVNFIFMKIFGVDWLKNGECFTSFYRLLSKLSWIWIKEGKIYVGFFGSQLKDINTFPPMSVLFLSIILATLSFDGLNETFLWFKIINVNPLEFYGRSSVVLENSSGLIFFAILLFLIFSITIFLGHKFINEKVTFKNIIGINSIALLPIALAYHIAHYLTSFLVNIQYSYKVASDPLNNGMDLLNLGDFNVTTSFFNTIETVKLIWFIQAAAIVIGHVIAVLLAHSICEGYLKTKSSILISQFPISIFMIGYTFLGLWILSTPTVG